MFHFPASPPAPYDIQTRVTPHNGRRVPPFGNPRITARKPAPRGISQATASFIGPRCQGIHRTLIKTNNTQHNTRRTRDAHQNRRAPHDEPNKKTNKRATAQHNHDTAAARRCSRPLCSSQPTRPQPPTPPKKDRGGPEGPDTRAHRPRTRQHATPPTPPPRNERKQERGEGPGPPPHGGEPAPPVPAAINEPLRKEVIQPHLPVRLPCYDFVPITGPAFDRSPWGHGLRASPTFMT